MIIEAVTDLNECDRIRLRLANGNTYDITEATDGNPLIEAVDLEPGSYLFSAHQVGSVKIIRVNRGQRRWWEFTD